MPSDARPLAFSVRVRKLVETVRWAPAPRFEGSLGRRLAFVGYVAGSMVAWVLVGVGLSALLGALVG